MRRISKVRSTLAAFSLLSLGACSEQASKQFATPDTSDETKAARVKECLESDSMLALNKEGAFVNTVYVFDDLLGLANAYVTLPNGKHDTFRIDSSLTASAGNVKLGLNSRVTAALADAGRPYMKGDIDAKEASRRIEYLKVGADTPKYNLGEKVMGVKTHQSQAVRPAEPAKAGTFLKNTNG